MKNLKKYRVWHTEKRICGKLDNKEMTEVSVFNISEAKQKVKDMFPNHRVTTCWLIEK